MKQFDPRYSLICIFLCVLCWTSDAQKADSLFLAGAFEKAAVSYELQYFNAPDITASSFALLQKARCYKNLEQFDKALHNLNRIPVYSIPDSLALDVQYEVVLNTYLAGEPEKTEFLLSQYKDLHDNQGYKARMLMLEVLTYNKLNKYSEAKESLLALMEILPETERNINADSIYSRTPKLKDPLKAKILSAVIPGSGHVYAGYPGEGITSFVLQAAAAGFGVYKISQAYYFTGIFTGFGLFQRFYFGGIARASHLAELKNKERTNLFNRQVFMLMPQ